MSAAVLPPRSPLIGPKPGEFEEFPPLSSSTPSVAAPMSSSSSLVDEITERNQAAIAPPGLSVPRPVRRKRAVSLSDGPVTASPPPARVEAKSILVGEVAHDDEVRAAVPSCVDTTPVYSDAMVEESTTDERVEATNTTSTSTPEVSDKNTGSGISNSTAMVLYDPSVSINPFATAAAKRDTATKEEERHAPGKEKKDAPQDEEEAEVKERKYRGLNNLGNTCYLNSALQMVLSLDSFVDDLMKVQEETKVEEEEEMEVDGGDEEKKDEQDEKAKRRSYPLRDALIEVAKSLREPSTEEASTTPSLFSFKSSDAVNPRELKATIDKLTSQFVGYRQQDSHEFLSTLLDVLHDEMKPVEENKKEDEKEEKEVVEGATEQANVTEDMEIEGKDGEDPAEVPDQTAATPATETAPETNEATTTHKEPECGRSSFSKLNVEAISDLLHGPEYPSLATSKQSKRSWSAVAASCSAEADGGGANLKNESTSMCKLVGGRCAVVPSSTPVPLRRHDEEDDASPRTDPIDDETSDEVGEGSETESATEVAALMPLPPSSPAATIEPSTPVDDHFTMSIRTRLTCDSCKYSRCKTELYRHLSVEIGTESEGAQTVEEGLRKFFAPEKRELKCEKCFCESATQTMEIARLPRALLLHFKRFIVDISPDFTRVTYRKNQSPVEFSDRLTISEDYEEVESVLGEHLAPDVSIPTVQEEDDVTNDDHEESVAHLAIPGEDATQALSSSGAPKKRRSPTYRLRSVVNHIGSSANCGHYTADGVRDYHTEEEPEAKVGDKRKRREWTRFNDSRVTKVESADVMGPSARRTAYMVMYELE